MVSRTSFFREDFLRISPHISSSGGLTIKTALGAIPLIALVAFETRRKDIPMSSWRGSSLVRCSAEGATTQEAGYLEVQFCGKSETFTPIYSKEPSAATASVNAGDYGLYVGGGSINLGFAKTLGLDPRKNAYKDLHEAVAEVAQSSPGTLQNLKAVPDETKALEAAHDVGLLGCFARAPASSLGAKSLTGIAFLDVFDHKTRPLSDRNVAMLYVVGPKGQGAVHSKGAGHIISDCSEFLAAVQTMSENALLLVCEYNQTASRGLELPQVQAVQFCLVSGGVYKHADASKVDVAAAIVRGLAAAASAQESLPVVRFAYDEAAFEGGCWLAAQSGCLLKCT